MQTVVDPVGSTPRPRPVGNDAGGRQPRKGGRSKQPSRKRKRDEGSIDEMV